ncbi:MAG TPA: PAS domain S-box protein [Bacteroidales bacterium]
MGYQSKTKDELIKELKKLHKDYVSLNASYEKYISDRKLSESELQESEERYRLLFENSGEAILLTNPDGSVYSANPEACRVFGWSEEEICKIGRAGTVDSEDPRLKQALIERNKSGKFRGELTHLKKDGTRFPGEITSITFKDRSGNERTSIIIRDNSERKLADEKVRNSEAEYRSLFENSIMAISQAYPDGKFFRINKAYATMYGYPDTGTMLKELSGNAQNLYSNPDDRKRVLAGLEENDTMSPSEFELIRRNGEKFWALVGVKRVRDNTGKPLYLQAEHIDITNLKRVENERYLAALYSRNLLEASLDPLVTISKNGKITDVNRSTEEITGINRNKLIGTDFADYFTEPTKARKGYKIVFSKGIVNDYPLTIFHISGRKIDVLYNATLYKNEEGEVLGVFAAARDITERKKIEEELRTSKELLEKLNAHLNEVREDERSKIALNLHDDFGQRLTALNLDLAWLKSRMGVQSTGVKKKLEEMSLMINESIDSIRELSSFLRPAILYELGLVPAFEWQLKKFENQSGIKCHFNCKPKEFQIEDDISLILYRILQESLTNILRHSEASEVVIDLGTTKMNIKLTIKDNGKGIEEEKISSPESMGITGIIERIRSVNGKISIKGIKDKGTVLEISIPLTKIKG